VKATYEPDPRPAARERDVKAMRIAKLREPWCVICGERTGSAHHIVGKGGGRGDDVAANLTGLCGDGVAGCHGLVTRRDCGTCRKLGEYLLANRADFLLYLAKKTDGRSADWFRRNLYVDA
jgi:hypothetical protein